MKERDFQEQNEFQTFQSEDQSDEQPPPTDPAGEDPPHILFCSSCIESHKTSEFDDSSKIRCPDCEDRLKDIGPESILEETINIQNQSVPVFFENRYIIQELIGTGGNGYVFKVEDLELNRICALKLISTRHAKEQNIERFEREARLTARLNHENIIDIIDYGRSENTAYYSMTHIKGESLHELIQDAHVPPGAALKIIRNAALALHHAHINSIIHRDIKPHNIMIVPKEEFIEDETSTDLDTSLTLSSGEIARNYNVILMDFGLGKSLEQDKQLTRTGQIFGTPHYMSPEQAQGLTDHVDEQSDIYSMGVVLYQLLSSKLPFDADNVNNLLKDISEEDPTPLKTHLPNVDQNLEALVHKAIRKEPDRRYETALDFAQDCERFLRGEPVQAREPGLLYHLKKSVRRNRTVVGIVATVFLAVSAFTGMMKYNRHTRYQTNLKNARLYLKETKPEKAVKALDSAATQYQTVAIQHLRKRANTMIQKQQAKRKFKKGLRQMEQAEQIEEEDLQLSTIENARSLLESAARTYPEEIPDQWKNPLEEARRKAYTIAFHQVRSEVELVQEVMNEINRREQEQIPFTEPLGKFNNLYEKAKENIKKLKKIDTADTWWAAGHVADRMGFTTEATSYYRSALKHNPNHRLALVDLGTHLIKEKMMWYFIDRKGKRHREVKQKIKEAIDFLEKAREKGDEDRYEKLAGPQFQKKIQRRIRLEKLYEYLVSGEYKKLEQNGTKRLNNEFHWEYSLLLGIGRFARSDPDARKAFRRTKEARPGNARVLSWYTLSLSDDQKKDHLLTKAIQQHPRYRRSWYLRGNVNYHKGNHQKAIEDYTRAIDLDPTYSLAYLNRGEVRRIQEQYQKALNDFNQFLTLNPDNPEAYYLRGTVKRSLGRIKEANEDQKRAIDLEPELEKIFNNRGEQDWRQGSYKQALEDFHRALDINPEYAEAYYNRGNAYRVLEQYQKAIADYSRAIDLDRTNAKAFLNRGTARYHLERYEEALNDYTSAISKDPELTEAYYNRGSVKRILNKYKEALADLNRAIELKPEYSKAFFSRGKVHLKLNHPQKAITDFTKSIELNSKSWEPYLYRGRAYIHEAGELREGLNDLRRARKLISENTNIKKKIQKEIQQTEKKLRNMNSEN